MEVVRFDESRHSFSNMVITVGTFDGLHIGHKKIFKQVCQTAQKINAKSGIISFDPHPRSILYPELGIKLITTLEEKMDILSSLEYSLDYFIIIPFNKSFAKLTGLNFLDFLNTYFLPSCIVLGEDHHFGRSREGNKNLLQEFCEKKNITHKVVNIDKLSSVKIGSSLIRKKIINGEVEEVKQYLDRPYSIKSSIIYGEGIGRKIGFPTANLSLAIKDKILPQKKGVYACKIRVKGAMLACVTNIGIRPTVNKTDSIIQIETHILDFNEDIYNEEITLFFHFFIREEKLFKNVEELKKQILNDIEKSKALFNLIE